MGSSWAWVALAEPTILALLAGLHSNSDTPLLLIIQTALPTLAVAAAADTLTVAEAAAVLVEARVVLPLEQAAAQAAQAAASARLELRVLEGIMLAATAVVLAVAVEFTALLVLLGRQVLLALALAAVAGEFFRALADLMGIMQPLGRAETRIKLARVQATQVAAAVGVHQVAQALAADVPFILLVTLSLGLVGTLPVSMALFLIKQEES
jgi:hypothetical protein